MRGFLLLSLIGLVTTSSQAGQIHLRSLEQVLGPDSWVLEARLVECRITRSERAQTACYTVEPVELLHGSGVVRTLCYSRALAITRLPNGKILGMSQVVTGSGLEFQLQEGQTYLFIGATSPGREGQRLLRLEPLSRKARVMEILSSAQPAKNAGGR